jgi:hypothetical protein
MEINIVDNERGTMDVILNSEEGLKQYGGLWKKKSVSSKARSWNFLMGLNFVPACHFEQAYNFKIDTDHVFKISNYCGTTVVERTSDNV